MDQNEMIESIIALTHGEQLVLFKHLLQFEKLKCSSIDEIVSISPQLKRWMEFTKEQTDAPDRFSIVAVRGRGSL